VREAGADHTHQGTMVPRSHRYKALNTMGLVGPAGLEPATKGL
jgi:hypothetical protein